MTHLSDSIISAFFFPLWRLALAPGIKHAFRRLQVGYARRKQMTDQEASMRYHPADKMPHNSQESPQQSSDARASLNDACK